jgi:hypothetical protein
MIYKNAGPLMDKADDAKGGGGGAPAPADDFKKEIDLLKAQNVDLMAKLEKLISKPKDDALDEDLNQKAKKQRDADDKKAGDHKALEAALRFSLKSDEFLKTNAALLPKDVSDIFKAAEKENYSSAIEKDAAVKAGIIQSFFSVQANLDLLTPGVKNELEEYLKLTKTGKQEKAQQIYNMIFEPAFEMLKRVKKAEALQKGFGNPSDTESAYKQKLVNLSRKHYLGEKTNGT